MIGHGALLVLSLAGTITVIYRAPLREAWLASRPAIPSKS
jgi:hypothetical protein